ncbi:MAG: DUF4249 domain-containing protein [Flavobacteriales bacterium]|nr:DUF4249 domain-containing protein [Flavobacteriales bacterium]
MRKLLFSLTLLTILSGCEKTITVDLPPGEEKIVIEGTIEPGQPPIVIVTKSQSYFAPTDLTSFLGIYVQDATVIVNDGVIDHLLTPVCSDLIPDSLLDEAAALTGIDPQLLANANICIYTKPDLLGEVDRSYSLRVQVGDEVVTSRTHIPEPVELDSLWFRLSESDGTDTVNGFIWARFTDPDTTGNNYRIQTRRINLGEDGRPKDDINIAPIGSTSNDAFINGLTVDFVIFRGNSPYETDPEELANFSFARNDTVVVRLLSMGRDEYDFYRSFESNISTQGDIFTTPANVMSNIEGGLGVWAGLGVYERTVVCVPSE